jgi:2'-5' RNA ligase
MKRMFIAVEVVPEPGFLSMNSTLRSLLGNEKITWTDPANLHITLAFLGDTEEERIAISGIILQRICKDFSEFRFNLRGTGIFKNHNDPRVIWCGIEQSKELVRLNDLIMIGLKDAGFNIEVRQFKPHITLGRIKLIRDTESLKAAIEQFHSTFIQEVFVQEVILFESILKPSGSVYKTSGRFKLLA